MFVGVKVRTEFFVGIFVTTFNFFVGEVVGDAMGDSFIGFTTTDFDGEAVGITLPISDGRYDG